MKTTIRVRSGHTQFTTVVKVLAAPLAVDGDTRPEPGFLVAPEARFNRPSNTATNMKPFPLHPLWSASSAGNL